MTSVRDNSTYLNRLAQGLDPLEQGVMWFNAMEIGERRAIFRDLGVFVLQAHPTAEEVHLAVAQSGLRPTVTPVVMLVNTRLREAVAKMQSLPPKELERSFCLLILLLGIADMRRREGSCAEGCTHWWHQLS